MKEPYTEGQSKITVATSHARTAVRGYAKRSTVVVQGRYRAPKKTKIRVPTWSLSSEGNITGIVKRDDSRLCVVGDPIHVQRLFARELGDPVTDHRYVKTCGPY